MSSETSIPELVLLPIMYIIVAALSLFSFNNLIKFVLASASGKATNSVVKSIQPYLATIKPWVENLFGSSFTIKLEHILLASVLVVLIGIYRSVQINNELLKQQVDAAAKAQKAPRKGANVASEASASKED